MGKLQCAEVWPSYLAHLILVHDNQLMQGGLIFDNRHFNSVMSAHCKCFFLFVLCLRFVALSVHCNFFYFYFLCSTLPTFSCLGAIKTLCLHTCHFLYQEERICWLMYQLDYKWSIVSKGEVSLTKKLMGSWLVNRRLRFENCTLPIFSCYTIQKFHFDHLLWFICE